MKKEPKPCFSDFQYELNSKSDVYNKKAKIDWKKASKSQVRLLATFLKEKMALFSVVLSSFCCCSRNCSAKLGGTSPCCTRTIPLWSGYVDDTFTAVHKDRIDDFHEHLNRQNADIRFTKEIEEDGKIPFLDCLVTRNNNRLPTHTDRSLDQSSYNPTSHKATIIRTLTR